MDFVLVSLLGLPALVFIVLLLLDKQLSLSLKKFLRFCKFVILSDLLVLGGVFALWYLNEKVIHMQLPPRYHGEWILGLITVSIFISIGHIIGYVRYRNFAKAIESQPNKTPQGSVVLASLELFFGLISAGYILLATASGVADINASIFLDCIVLPSAFVTILVQWRKRVSKRINKNPTL